MPLIRSAGRLEPVGTALAMRESAEMYAGQIDSDDWQYRALGISPRDLREFTHQRVLEIVFDLYKSNGLGHRITTLSRDFVVGDGVRFSVPNPNIEDIVGEFWDDEDNRLNLRMHDFALELGLYGEQCYDVFVGDVAGVVKIGYIDPAQIKKVEALDTDGRRNPLILDKVWVRRKGFGVRGEPLDIIRTRNGQVDGQVFFMKVNSPSNATRGWPDLLHAADWLDAYDQMLWEILERARLMRAFIWDVTLKGANQEQVDTWLKRNGAPPKSGSVRAHNEQVEWNAESPQLGSYETAKDAEVILEHIGGGTGIPKHWLASAEDVNRATAREMGTPTERQLATRQKYFLESWKQILRFVLLQADKAGRILDKDPDGKVPIYDEDGAQTDERKFPHELVSLHAPEINTRDQGALGTLFFQTCQALAVAEQEGWIPRKATKQVIASVVAQMGVDYDPDDDDEVDQADEANVEITGPEPPSRGRLRKAAAAATPPATPATPPAKPKGGRTAKGDAAGDSMG